jgi:hypothetical protein
VGAFDLSEVVWDSRVLSGGLTPEYDRFVSHLVVGGEVLRGTVLSQQSVKKAIGVFGDALGCSPASSSSVQEIKLSLGNLSLSSPISLVLLESHPSFSWFTVFGGVFASSGSAAGHYLGSSSAGASEASSVTSGTFFSTAAGPTIQADTLNGIAATFAGSGTRRAISINGSTVTQDTNTRLPSSISAVYVATYVDAGVQQIGFRGSNYLFAVINKALSDQELRFLSANPRALFADPQPLLWVPSAANTTITCSVGNANATGVTALVSRSIPCAVGNANATGVTSLVSLAIPCSVGNANATGVTATISAGGSVTITCSVANANATGPSALISTTVQCSVANAASAGVTAAIQSGLVITTAMANALATGIQAAINAAISASVGNANASGVTASVQGQGIASLLPDRRYTVIGAAPGYVIAAAGRNYQVTIQ